MSLAQPTLDLIMLEQANQDDMSESNIMSWEEAYGI